MNDDLFFIPILAEAIEDSDPTSTLERALERIRKVGRAQRYETGYRQWRRFIEAATAGVGESERLAVADAAIWMAIARLCGENVETGVLTDGSHRVQRPARGSADLSMMRKLRAIGLRRGAAMLMIQRESRLVASRCLDPVDQASISGVRPGAYTLTLDTGRLLWSGHITDADLIWDCAFPGRPLVMAADSTFSSAPPTKTIPLTVGPVALVVYPCVETGSLQLEPLERLNHGMWDGPT